MRTFLLSCLLAVASLAPVQASVIAVFDNPVHVDTAGGPPTPGSDAVQGLLASLGHTVNPFTGMTAADFAAATGASDLILFPHLLNFGALANDLSASAKSALASYVLGGGGLIVLGDSANRLLNALFYPSCPNCLSDSGGSGPSFKDGAVAAGTPFATAPAVLTDPPAAGNGVNPFAFTPAGALNLYRDQVGGFPNSTTVMTAPVGAGHWGLLAWDFVGAELGTLDGGWSDVLNIMVSVVESPAAAPEPGSLSILILALLMLACAFRLRGRARLA